MISIVTPVLNGAKFIEKNIQSIQKLTIPFEHIIVDGGSTDDTLNIVQKYSHLKVFNQTEKTGMYGGIDLGFKNSTYDIITWINCDDLIVKENFEEAVLKFQEKKIDFLYGGVIYTNNNDKTLVYRPPIRFTNFFLKKGIMAVAQSSTLYKRNLYFKCKGLNFKKFKLLGDLDLFNRFSKHTNTIFFSFNKPISIFYLYDGSLLASNPDRHKVERGYIENEPSVLIQILYKLMLIPYYLNKYIINKYFFKFNKLNR
ncbi:MAG TPA: hypothetical protein DD724_03525 [Lactobacillus acetotolerans]|nr:hypothetical protein [Lactobacillus acetotolerans]